MKRILFVDDEPNVLSGLRRMLRGMRGEWDMAFAPSAEDGLRLADEQPFDVVVSDMRMPGMDGAEFLSLVRKRHPATVRIILSGQSDKENIMRSVGPTHQFLAKPCEAEQLKQVINQVTVLSEILESAELKSLVAEIERLPSLPALFVRISDELDNPDATSQSIAAVIESDISMSAEILKLVNSAFFGLSGPVNSLQRAVHFLGVDTIRGLVLGVGIFQKYEGPELPGFSLESLWAHSIEAASLARALAEHEGVDRPMVADAYLAGMLHDVGRLVLAIRAPELAAQVAGVTDGEEVARVEREKLHVTHPEVGAYLLGLWGFSYDIVRAVAFHHEPSQSGENTISPLCFVYGAEALLANRDLESLDAAFLESVGFGDRWPEWEDVARDFRERLAA